MSIRCIINSHIIRSEF
uniref:Uncharacterized protein n=1 Tax=Rhizophora mucronata TaxID=61149 RepID=A0A2P2Q009_RHIMU